MALILGIIMLVGGIYALNHPERVRIAMNADFENRQFSARTYESQGIFVGIFGIIAGGILLVFGVAQVVDNNTNASATATADENYDSLIDTLNPLLPTLRAQSEPDTVYLLTNDERGTIGLDEEAQVVYGQCRTIDSDFLETDEFFVVVVNWNGSGHHYAYGRRGVFGHCQGQLAGFSGRGWIEIRLAENYYDSIVATVTAQPLRTLTPQATPTVSN